MSDLPQGWSWLTETLPPPLQDAVARRTDGTLVIAYETVRTGPGFILQNADGSRWMVGLKSVRRPRFWIKAEHAMQWADEDEEWLAAQEVVDTEKAA